MNPQQLRRLPALFLLLVLPACSGGGLGTLGDILGGVGLPGQAGGDQLRAEIQQVDSRRQQIQIRTEDGRTGAVLYDQRTEVIYRQQQYPVTALERGDLVRIELQQDRSGNPYAARILVEQSVQERTGQTSPGAQQLQQMEGRVGQIDAQRGIFELQTQYGGTLIVSLPYNPPSALEDRFRRLRTGDVVRIEGRPLGENRFELYGFR